MSKCCKDCKWWKHRGGLVGFCYRMPKTESKRENSWCGEFYDRKLAKARNEEI